MAGARTTSSKTWREMGAATCVGIVPHFTPGTCGTRESKTEISQEKTDPTGYTKPYGPEGGKDERLS